MNTKQTLLALSAAVMVALVALIAFINTLPDDPVAPTATIDVAPTTITVGQSATLTWTTTDATSATLNGAAVDPNDTLAVSPGVGTHVYTLIATGPGGEDTDDATLIVEVEPPPSGTVVTAQAGNWTNTTTWVGATVPTVSDEVILSHAVAVDGTVEADTVRINAPLLVVGQLTAEHYIQGNATVTHSPGSRLRIASGGSYTMGTANAQPNCKHAGGGTAENKAWIEALGQTPIDDIGGGSGWDTTNWDVQHVTFKNIRNAAATLGIRHSTWGASMFRMQDCLFDNCGPILTTYGVTPSATTPFDLTRCRWDNTPGRPLEIRLTNTGGQTCRISGCSFDGTPIVYQAVNTEIVGNCFANVIDLPGNCAGSAFRDNFMRYTSNAQEFAAACGWKDCYLIHDQTTGNPHFVSALLTDLTFDGLVFDYPHPLTFDTGDCVLGMNVGNLLVKNCLVVPGESDGHTPGFLANIGVTTGVSNVKLLHNTVCGKQAMVAYVKDYGANAQVYEEVKSNIAYSPEAGEYKDSQIVYDLHVDDLPYDVAKGSGCTHNAIYNPFQYTDPSNGNAVYQGYNQRFATSGTPGANDVIADPQFAAYGRNLPRWAVYKGAAQATDTLRQKLDAAVGLLRDNPSLCKDDLIPWVRAGYKPANAALLPAHDGNTTIGAIAL